MGSQLQPHEKRQGVRRSPWTLVAVLVCVVAVYTVTARSPGIPEGWETDYDAALAVAIAEDRNVVAAFHMRGCPPCAVMDRLVLGSAAVRDALAGFVPVRVDIDQRPDLAARLGVFATPTYAVLDADGRLISKCEGYQSKKAFAAFLEQAVTARRDLTPTAPFPTGDP